MTGVCPFCNRVFTIRTNGRLHAHGRQRLKCAGSGALPEGPDDDYRSSIAQTVQELRRLREVLDWTLERLESLS